MSKKKSARDRRAAAAVRSAVARGEKPATPEPAGIIGAVPAPQPIGEQRRDLVVALGSVARRQRRLDHELRELVAEGRGLGLSWDAIAAGLGLARGETIRRRYGASDG